MTIFFVYWSAPRISNLTITTLINVENLIRCEICKVGQFVVFRPGAIDLELLQGLLNSTVQKPPALKPLEGNIYIFVTLYSIQYTVIPDNSEIGRRLLESSFNLKIPMSIRHSNYVQVKKT